MHGILHISVIVILFTVEEYSQTVITCSKLTIETLEQVVIPCSSVSIFNFEHVIGA